ncbi:MAG: hypothetical protein ACKO7B_02735, partial [Flavobacteriales bacterium]
MGLQAAETKKKSRTNWFVLTLNSIACLGLLLTYAAAAFSPSAMGYLALFGLAYPFVLSINILFIFFWLFKKRRNTLLSSAFILLGWNHFTDFFQVSTKGNVDPEATQLKVLTYNVHVFDVFDKKDGATT